MKILLIWLIISLFVCNTAQLATAQSPAASNRISFMLKNTLGYHCMFRVEGPGIAYGFTMGRRETVACHWPVGAKLYFSADGETTNGLILTVTAADEGKTLTTDQAGAAPKSETVVRNQSASNEIRISFRNNSLLPRKVAIITYKPGERGNATQIVTLMPYASTKQRLPVGTKVYFADDKQVGVVMSGQPLTDKPSLIVSKDDAGETVDIW